MMNALKKPLEFVSFKMQSLFNASKLQKILFISYLVLLPLLCLTRDVFHIAINKYLFVAFCLIFSILLNNNYFLYLFVYTLPFAVGLPDLFIFGILVAFIIIRFFNKFSIKYWILIISVPLFFCLLEIVLTLAYGNLNIKDSIRLFSVLFFLSFCFYNRKLFNYKHVLMLIFGYVVTYILITFQVIEVGIWGIRHRAYDWVNFKYLLNAYRFGSREDAIHWVNTGCKVPYPYASDMRIGENSNNVGLSALIGGASAYFIYPVIQNKKDKIICIILGIVIVLFGFWTNSRSFILFVILLGIAMLVLSIIHKRAKPINAIIVLFLVLLIISLLLVMDIKALIRIVNRFFANDTSSAGNRLTLIGDYFSKMFTNANYVLFGVGATNILHEYALSAPPHTNFVQLSCGYGLPITLLFIGLIIYCLIKFQKRIKITNYRFGFYVPMIFGFLFTLTDQIFFPTSILISFISTIIIASFNNKKSEIIVPEDVHYLTILDNFNSCHYFAAQGLLIDDKKRNNVSFNPSEIVSKEQCTKFIQDIIQYKPAYIVVNYENLNHQKILSKQFRKIKTSILIVVCDRNTDISFVERVKKFLFWDKCLFVYRDEITAIKFENKKFVRKYQELIVGDSPLIVDDILNYLKK